jgi:RNA polymerase sigma factor (sigma-70 family)
MALQGFMNRMPVERRGAETAESEALAFEDFFRAHYARLAQALLLLTGDRAEAEDLAQEAMARVYERWERVQMMESPQGYAYRAALNLNRKRLRWSAVRARHRLEAPAAPDPLQAVETRLQVLQTLDALPRSQREAVVLVGWLGLDAEEAGRILGVAPSTVRVRLHRARAALRATSGGPDE